MNPLSFTFQGKHEDEVILYVSRMHLIALLKNWFLITLAVTILVTVFLVFSKQEIMGLTVLPVPIQPVIVIFLFAWVFALWWAWKIWRETYFVITDRRLVKLGYHSPFTSYQSSTNLGEVEDAAATARSILERILGVGTFYARPGPGAVFDFWFEYLPYHRDIHNYVMKMLYTLKHDSHPAETLKAFRPFIPKKAGVRY